AAPAKAFRERGYHLVHHGQGRWNGVAIASREEPSEILTNFGEPLREAGEAEPLAEARMIAARVGGLRVVSVYVPNGREIDSPFYEAKLVWLDRLARYVGEVDGPTVVGGDFNVAPADADVWDPKVCHGGTHVSGREREAFERVRSSGQLVDMYRKLHSEGGRYSWWDYRAGAFHMNYGMRIDHLLVSEAIAGRIVYAEIDRQARKGKPTPSDHAPVVIDLDEPGVLFDAGWAGAEERIAARRKKN
ncbi:MAG: endonuclease/exonuclease/phosphatase family protein, partial [Sandaracinaceae bacterium]|nr:endonuclease/exonuclease/phosphatase family protein [Sandaracinaceae bacterium]